MFKLFRGELRAKDNANDDKDWTLTSSVNIKQHSRQQHQANKRQNTMKHAEPVQRSSVKDQQFPGNNKKTQHITTTPRRIRRPPQWLGNYDWAQARSPKETSNDWRNANAIVPLQLHNTNNEGINDDYDAENAKNKVTQRRSICKSGLLGRTKSFIIEFLQDSSIHGFGYLSKLGLHFIERTMWFAFICVAIFSIISLSRRTWHRFQTSPMVISMDRNKLVWNTSFPSVSLCPHKRIDELKVEEYMMAHEDVFATEDDKEGFKDFIEKLGSLSYENIDQLPTNNSYGLRGENYLDLLNELKWPFKPEMNKGTAVKLYIYETQTEFGICHSVNSLVARYNSHEYRRNNEWHLMEHGDLVTVHPLNGEIYAQIVNLSSTYDVYFHSSGEIPSRTKQRYTFPATDYTSLDMFALEISTVEAGKDFSPKQRQCRFKHEAGNMLTAPIYSFGLCLAECRMFLALRMCKCVPHFYRNKLRNGRVLPICDITGLGCVANLKSEMLSLKSTRFKIDCNCLANCDESNFFVQSYTSRVWFLGASFQWGITEYPKMQLRRDVLFSFADVLVYIGGLVGFFLGCSALSFTEVIYFFTIKLAKRLFCKN